jgi:hypothetical protein
MISRSELDAAKDRLRLPELWKILGLTGEPPSRDGCKFKSPLRPDKHPSCSFYDDGRRMMDWSDGKSYDGIQFLGEALGVENGEAIRRFVEIANGRPITVESPPIIRAESDANLQTKRPSLSGLRTANRYEVQQIANNRKIDPRAVELAQNLGTLRVGKVCRFFSWVILDQSGICAEGRRINRKPYPAIESPKFSILERKAHTLRGSQKNWPVGVLPAREYRQSIEAFVLVEGGPDYLAALHFGLAQKRTGILPVAILGRGQGLRGLHADSLAYIRGHRVRIYPHADVDGGSYEAALSLCKQLQQQGCQVDFYVFSELRKADGAAIKDLNDCVEIAPGQADELEELFP